MRYPRSLFPAIVLSFIFGATFAQQVPMYSQYMMNGFLINPSFAGRDGYTTVNLTVREQWVGMTGAPSTYAASFQTRILKNSFISKSTSVRKKIVKPTRGGKVGLGGYIFNDQQRDHEANRSTGLPMPIIFPWEPQAEYRMIFPLVWQ